MSVFVIVTCFLWISWGACIIRFMVTKRFFAGPPWPVCLEYLEILAVQLVLTLHLCMWVQVRKPFFGVYSG